MKFVESWWVGEGEMEWKDVELKMGDDAVSCSWRCDDVKVVKLEAL